MADYLELDIAADAGELYDEGLATMQSLAPEGWEPSEVEQWILAAAARMGVEVALLAGNVSTAIFTYFGQSILNIAAETAVRATSSVTFATLDTGGHTIDASTQLSIDGVAFTTDAELDIPLGADTGSIGITAVNAGTDANDLAGDVIDIVTPSYLFIDTVVLDAPTAGGKDGETGDEYVDRLADELPTLTPKAILIDDFPILARRNPAVGRALGIDNLNPDSEPVDTDAEGHITVVVHDTTGADVDPDVLTAIKNDLEANRVLGIVVHVRNPERTTIDVAFTIDVYDDYDSATVITDAEAAVTAYLGPATWGAALFGDPEQWVNETTVFRTDLIGVVRNVPGVRHVTGLTLAADGDPLAETDVVMPGIAPLPTAGTIAGALTP